MKPFFGTDLTLDKHNETANGNEFLVQMPSNLLTQSLENATDAIIHNLDKGQLPHAMQIIQWISGIAGVAIIGGALKFLAEDESITLTKIYTDASWLFWLAGTCLIICGVLTFINLRKSKEHFYSDESNQVFDNHDAVCDAIYTELNLPANAVETDILTFYYKVKDGNIKVCNTDYQLAPYESSIFYVFVENSSLCLINLGGRYEFPLDSIKTIHTVNKTITIDEWTKNEPHNKGMYKQYKLREIENGCILCKSYHIIELKHNGELWGIYIPSYELHVFEELIGINAE